MNDPQPLPADALDTLLLTTLATQRGFLLPDETDAAALRPYIAAAGVLPSRKPDKPPPPVCPASFPARLSAAEEKTIIVQLELREAVTVAQLLCHPDTATAALSIAQKGSREHHDITINAPLLRAELGGRVDRHDRMKQLEAHHPKPQRASRIRDCEENLRAALRTVGIDRKRSSRLIRWAATQALPLPIEQSLHQVNQLRCTLIEQNLKLVIWTMGRNFDGGTGWWLRFIAGCEGLEQAIDKVDPSQDNRFGTYARPWIRARLTRQLQQTTPIRHTNTVNDFRMKYLRAQREAYAQEARAATAAEIAATTGREASTYARLMTHPVDTRDLLDALLDVQPPATEQAQLEAFWRLFTQALAALSERDRRIIQMRYGLNVDHGDHAMTLAEIGKHFDLSRERIRQLIKAGLRSMQVALRSLDLSDVLPLRPPNNPDDLRIS